MYKIIGADQKEYGPVSGDQLRQWLVEGRVNGQTAAQAEGDTAWKPLSMFPEIAGSFSAAPPPFSPFVGASLAGGNGRLRALQDISGPAIGLMVTAGLGILFALLEIALNLLGTGTGNLNARYYFRNQNTEMVRVAELANGAVGVVLHGIGILICIFILYGALKMKKLENYGLCTAVSIIVMIPCFSPCLSPCCVLGLPMGIWALVILNKPETKGNFS